MHTALLLLLFLSISSVISFDNPPELKFAFNYQFLDYIKTSFLKPIIEDKVKNLTLTNTFSIKKDLLQLNISNISFTDFQIDWSTSGLTVLENRQHPSLVLHNLSLNFTFDSQANFLVVDLQGKNNKASVQNLDIQIDLIAGYSPEAVSCVHIDNAAVSIQKIDIQMSKSVPHILLLLAKAFGAKFEVIAGNAIQEKILDLNQTLIDKTSSHHTFTVHDMFAVNVSLAELPFIFNVQHQAYQALSFNVATKNIKTGQLAPVAPIDVMPDFIDGELPVQIIISESLLEQLLWGVFQTEFKYVLSQENVPKDFPAPLTTTGLKILFPDFDLIYGADKGIYINIETGGDDPRIYIRDGRLSGTASLNITLVVDTENKEYPQQGLDKCMEEGHCETAVEMNVTVFFGAVVYKKSSKMIGVKIMNIQLADVEVKRGTTDGKSLENLVNQLTVGLLGQINVQLATGIANPLIGLFGLNDASVAIGADYLLLGASFDGMEQLEA